MFIYHHPPHRDNVTAPHGRPSLRSLLHFGYSREGETTKSIRDMWHWGGKVILLLLSSSLSLFNCTWVDTRWQYRSHLHTNSTQNTEDGTHNNYKEKIRSKLGIELGSVFVGLRLWKVMMWWDSGREQSCSLNIFPIIIQFKSYLNTERSLSCY
jgi:hypothetical protein